MRAKEMARRLAGQLRRDFWEKGEIVLRSPALVQGAECARRFVLGAALSRSEILSGYAPFALGWVGASGSGPGGFAALLGAGLGYFLGLGMLNGLRYVAAAVLVYATAFALFDLRVYRRGWFMPTVTGAVTGVTGFIYLSEAGWTPASVAGCVTEMALAAVACLSYRQVPDLLAEPEEVPAAHRLFLAATVLVAFCPLSLPFGLSPGVIALCFLVLPAGEGEEPGRRTAVGAALGLAADLARGGVGLYTCALSAGGLLTEPARERSRFLHRPVPAGGRRDGGLVRRDRRGRRPAPDRRGSGAGAAPAGGGLARAALSYRGGPRLCPGAPSGRRAPDGTAAAGRAGRGLPPPVPAAGAPVSGETGAAPGRGL